MPLWRGCARCSTRRGWAARVCVLGGISDALPAAVHRLLRGSVVGAGDCVAGRGFSEPAGFPGPGRDRGAAEPLDAVAHAASGHRASDRALGASDGLLGLPMDAGGAGRLNRSSPSCLNRPAQRTAFFHGLLNILRREALLCADGPRPALPPARRRFFARAMCYSGNCVHIYARPRRHRSTACVRPTSCRYSAGIGSTRAISLNSHNGALCNSTPSPLPPAPRCPERRGHSSGHSRSLSHLSPSSARLPPSSPRWTTPSRRPRKSSTRCRSSSAA